MAVKNLYEDEMIQVTAVWIDPTSGAYTLIVRTPLLAALQARVVTAHNDLKEVLQPNETPRILAIIEEEAKLDVRHDTIIRGGWNGLTYLAELIGGDEGAKLLAVRDFLWPEGLAMQQKTYAAEAGAAGRLADRFVKSPAMRQTVDSISIGIGPSARTLGAYVDEYLQVAKHLGDLETERGQLLDGPTEARATQNAVREWIKVANAMLANGELSDLDPQSDAIIFGPLRLQEKKADERAREALNAAKKKAGEDTTAKPATPPTAAPAEGSTTSSAGPSESSTSGTADPKKGSGGGK
jgi:hypothetical protein